MSFLLPLRLRKQMAYNRRESQAEREGLLDSILPAPTHPRAKPRALATCSLAIFFLLVVWMAVDSVGKADREERSVWQPSMQRWVWESGVQMGNDGDSQKQQAQLQQEQEDDEENDDTTDEEDEQVDAEMKHGLAKYIWHEDLEWDAEGSGRLVIVGDVHGMVDELKSFLHELEYSPDQTRHHNDTLVFVGDLVAKHPAIKSSLKTLDYIRSLNAWAVRGNHDQDVLNWRAWMEKTSLVGLGIEEGDNEEAVNSKSTSSDDNDEEKRKEDEEVPENVPEILKHKWRDEHFKIAKQMSQESADWLKRRSMTLHIRSLHAYVVHAGLLPWTIPKNKGKKKKVHTQDGQEQETEEDVDTELLKDLDFSNEFGITSETSLLESSSETDFTPISSNQEATNKNKKNKDLDPEIAILTVPLNRKPFTLLEMRGLKKNGKVTKSTKKGVAWAPIWNQVMKGCQQTILESEGNDEDVDAEKMKPGQCRPLSVIYGHAAARGLDLHPFSFGLDSGAVYGRSFSALVVEGKTYEPPNDRKHNKDRKNGSSKKKNNYNNKMKRGERLKSKKLESVDVAIGGRFARVYSMKTKKP